jgi:hypothetical protein
LDYRFFPSSSKEKCQGQHIECPRLQHINCPREGNVVDLKERIFENTPQISKNNCKTKQRRNCQGETMNAQKIQGLEPAQHKLSSGETVFIHLFRPQDSPGIAQLFHAVYGDKYPVKRFYDPADLARALESGDNFSIVARRGNGEIIGHMGFFRSAPFAGLYETGAGLVLPQFRNEGLNHLLLRYSYEALVPALEIEEAWGEAVCNHVLLQKSSIERFKFIETGLEIDLMPQEAYAKEKSSSGRVTSLVTFRCFMPRPQAVYLPSVYKDVLTAIYCRLEEERTLNESADGPAAGSFSQASFEIFDFAQVVRIAVKEIGQDFESYFNGLETGILTGNIKVLQVWLNLGCSWVGRAVEILRARGYYFGALLPRWFGQDGLLMQKNLETPVWENIKLYSDTARELLEIIRNDREDVLSLKTMQVQG